MSAVARHAEPSAQYAEHLHASVQGLSATLQRYPGAWAQAHSLGAEDIVVTHLLHLSGRLDAVEVFVLDTGRLHQATLDLIPQVESHFAIRMRRHAASRAEQAEFDQHHGLDAMRQSVALRHACCALRKLAPLSQALAGKQGWITGLRREQSAARADVPLLENEGQRLKLNPLANWTWGDVWHHIAEHQLPYHPLHDAFYPSIGCAPCTRAISLGEDTRAGRWWWEQESAKECGLHTQPVWPLKPADASA